MKLQSTRIKAGAYACVLLLLFTGYGVARTVENEAFVQGCDAFKKGDWYSAMLLLRKATAFPVNDTAETWYMLIASEMYAASYAEAALDCDYYLHSFPDSMYVSYVQYQKGRASFYLGDYEKAVLLLSDFCHQYRDDELYASALFWIAESFFSGYNYDEARALKMQRQALHSFDSRRLRSVPAKKSYCISLKKQEKHICLQKKDMRSS